MPTVRIQYQVVRDIPAEGLHSVQVTVLDVEYIDAEIFVFDTEYSAFTGVATLHSMRNFPRTRAQAVTDGLDYWRAPGVARTFPSIDLADAFVAVTEGRIDRLRRDWQTYTDGFRASDTITTPEV